MSKRTRTTQTTVGKYLITRLRQAGLGHVFGIPGDYVLKFYDLLVASPIEVVGTCTEAGAAFATDAYARVAGLGCCCVTYCVGGLNTLNAVAGAYAEKSPVIVISGAPGLDERRRTPLLHHRVRDFATQRAIFEKVTVASVALEDPKAAPDQIDETIAACLRHKRPVYIELPRDVVDLKCAAPRRLRTEPEVSDMEVLAEALVEALGMLGAAKRPAILAGVEIHRFGLQNNLLDLVERSGFPIATTLLGKSIINELHPQHLGIYEGAMGREDVRRTIERADCVLILGAFMTDINLGIYTADLDIRRTINATSERVAIKHHSFSDIELRDFIEGLAARVKPRRKKKAAKPRTPRTFRARKGQAITVKRFFRRLETFLEANMGVVADVGDCLFGAADLTIPQRTEFLSPAYYTSMGFAVPAALGVQKANPELRPIVIVGDGAFQMTGLELSTIARQGLNPIVFVLNNKGYTTERFINEGPYNDILEWQYHRLPELFGPGRGFEVRTEDELEAALAATRVDTGKYSIVNVHLDKMDRSDALARLGQRLSEQGGHAKRS